MGYILALDQGTTSSRAILFDQAGRIHRMAQRAFEQYFPKAGWVEHDAQEIWASQIGVAAEVMRDAALGSKDIAGIGIANQRETTIVWDRATGEPIHRAIVWQDRRTVTTCDALRDQGMAETIQHKTGLVLDAYFAGTKLKWLLDHVDGAREKAQAGELAFGTVDTYLLWRLTGGKIHATDRSNASRTMLYNIHTGVWDDELLEILDVPRGVLPKVRRSSEVYGETAVEAFDRPIPIAGMAGDQQAALLGQMCLRPGLAKNTYGTGCFLLLNTGGEAVASKNNLLTTVAWDIEGHAYSEPGGDPKGGVRYALEGSIFMGGATVQWLRDGLRIIDSAGDVEALARTENDAGGVCLVPAFAGLGAPHWDPGARGLLIGMTRGTTAGHIARAALQGIALRVADVLDAMHDDAGLAMEELRVDGGASANDLLMQMQADVLQRPIVRPRVIQTTALGAAYLAGLAVGYWKDCDEIAEHWTIDRRFDPAIPEIEARRLRFRWREAIERAKGWARDGGE